VEPDVSPRVDVVANIGSAVVVRLRWRPRAAAADEERYQVLEVLDDKIREIAECLTMREATKLAKRMVAPVRH